jgi:hypothetical protein
MAHQLFHLPKSTAISNNLTLLPGAKVGFFITATSTPTDTYQDSALTTPHTNPVIADAAGRLPPVYLNPDILYRVTFTDSEDVEIYPTVDPINDRLLSQAIIGAYLNPRTAAEIASGVTPVDYAQPELYLDRYGDNVTPGTTDVVSFLDDAISVASEGAGLNSFGDIHIYSLTAISTTIVVLNGVTLDFHNNTVAPLSASLNMFEIRPGGHIKNMRVNVEAMAYTGTVITLKGDGGATAGFRGTTFRPWLDNFSCRMALDTTNGRHIFLDATGQYLQEWQASRINLSGGGTGIHLLGDETDPGNLEYAQGNLFDDINMFGVNNFIWCEGTASAGNIFTGLMLQQRISNPVCTIVLESAANYLQGKAWDDVGITVSEDGNVIDLLQSQAYGPAITDTARNNFSRSRGVQYLDRRSINTYGDVRQELHGPGTIEFRDNILGGFDPRWGAVVTSGSPTATFGYATFGAAAAHKQAMPYMEIICAPAAESYALNFGGNGFLLAAQNPTVHFTNYTNVADQRIRWQIGLYYDASNYIILTQDFATYADDDIRLITRSGGTSTTAAMTTAGGDHVNYCTILVEEGEVIALVKQYNNAGTGATGRVADGALWTGSLFVTTNSTTNIPTAVAMHPYVFVQQGSGANNAVMRLMHYSVVSGTKAIVA